MVGWSQALRYKHAKVVHVLGKLRGLFGARNRNFQISNLPLNHYATANLVQTVTQCKIVFVSTHDLQISNLTLYQ